ncbi:MAG: hypothetical protein WC791_02800 [Candidatus Paceibacterota bacterium]|jgi:hypothetical protein
MNFYKAPNLLLRIGVAFAFLFPAIDGIFNPYTWIGYFPKFMRGDAPDLVMLHGFAFMEVIIALWILSGKKIFYPSLFAAFLLVSIVLFNYNNFEILFRDIAISMMAFSLALGARDLKTE